jgi:Ca-activated chloride channel family protein
MKKILAIVLLFVGLSSFGPATTRHITGTVTDGKDALPGVTITVDGTSVGTQTDATGKYAIDVPAGKTKLSFRFTGYLPQTIAIGKNNTINVALKADGRRLEEVVVTGYGVQRRQSITGSVSAIQAESMNAPSVTLNNAFAGKVAGVVATSGRNKKAKRVGEIYGLRAPAPENDESYKGITENSFNNAKTIPLSTFSVDVDAASYSNIRRFINGGQLPPADAVRIEEMINYFNYNLPGPTNNEPVAIHTELTSAPWNPQHRLLRIGLKARTIPTQNLPPSNLVFLIDVSGSMSDDNKLPLVKSSLKMLVNQLRPQDKVAIVVYAGAAGMVLPPTSGDKKTTINNAIDNLEAGGSTAGGAGITLAYSIAHQNLLKEGNNRVILATDGDFNVGASSDDDMEKLITKQRESNIFLSVLGYGMGNYKDSKMEVLADKGNGNYAYIDNITEARKTLISEFGGTLFTVAKDVKLQVEFNPANVQAYRLVGYENRMLEKEDFNNDKKDAGDMGSGHTVTALYEIIPVGVKNDYIGSVDPLKYQQPAAVSPVVNSGSKELLTVKFRYKEPTAMKSKLSQAVVLDAPKAFAATSADFKFTVGVAEFGMLLRDSPYKQKATYEQAISFARAGKGEDTEGYRAEFIKLAESAKLLAKSEEVVAGR